MGPICEREGVRDHHFHQPPLKFVRRPLLFSNWRIVCLILVSLLAAPVLAVADDDPDPEYIAKKSSATEAFKAGRFAQAAQLYTEAFEISPRGNLLYNIGLSYENAGEIEQAVKFYERFVQALPNSPQRPAVQRQIATLKTSLRGRYVDVSVSSTPPGAIIFVNDKSQGAMGKAPLTFKLLPGSYVIIAEMEGHEPAKQRIQVAEGYPAAADISLLSSGEVGTVTFFVSERGADVMVDGRRIGRSPIEEKMKLTAGPHDILVVKPSFMPWKKKYPVKAGVEQRIEVRLTEEDDTNLRAGGGESSVWPWVVMGAGLAATGAGVFTGVSAQGLHDQLSQKRDKDQLIAPSDIDTGNSLVLMTNLLIGVGSVAIVGGVVMWTLDGGGVSRSGTVGAHVGAIPGGGTVQLKGTF